MKRLKIAFITVEDPRDRRTWSGTNYFLWQSMQKHLGDVELLQPAEPAITLFFCRLFNQVALRIFGKRFDWRRSGIVSRAYSRSVQKLISGKHFDLLVFAGRTALFSHLETEIPIAYIGDRTVSAGLNYHEQLKNLFSFSLKQSLETENMAFRKAKVLSFPSAWACTSAVNDSGMKPEQVFEIPFGANLDKIPDERTLNFQTINRPLTLLFLATRWLEKGGDIALDCLNHLSEKGIESKLIICGVSPELKADDRIEIIPFINKNDPQQFETLTKLFLRCDLLILPTRYDAYGIVFCEASAYGIPSIAPETGGISGAIKNGKNGIVVPGNSGGDVYAEKILEMCSDTSAFLQLKKNARKLFEEKLNWDNWGREFSKAISSMNLAPRNIEL